MTCIPFELENGRTDLITRMRDDLAARRLRFAESARQARVVAMVFALGAAFHVMKWAGLIVL